MARDPGNHFARVIVIDGKSGHKIKEKTWAMMAKKKKGATPIHWAIKNDSGSQVRVEIGNWKPSDPTQGGQPYVNVPAWQTKNLNRVVKPAAAKANYKYAFKLDSDADFKPYTDPWLVVY